LYRIIIFGHFSTQRDPTALSRSLARPFLENEKHVQHVILPVYPSAQRENNGLLGSFTVHTIADLDAAMRLATQLGSRTDDFGTSVLITGSFHLVGQALRALELSTA
jgi:folylpolyglutamate synthase/dihydropteroate synthase